MKTYKNMYIIQGLHNGMVMFDSVTGEDLTGMKLDYNEAIKLALKFSISEVAFIDDELNGHMINVATGVVTSYGKLSFLKGKLDRGIYSPKNNISIVLT